VKAIAFAKLLRKDLEVAAEFSFLADSGAVLERLHFTGHVQVEYISVSSERIFGCGPGTFRTSNINKVVKNKFSAVQCSGFVTFWYGSEPSYPYLSLTDPDPALIVSDLQVADKKIINFSLNFYTYSFLKVHLHHSLKIKVIFLLVDGKIRIHSNKLRTGCGSRRPKNIRIRIRNTAAVNIIHKYRLSFPFPWLSNAFLVRCPPRPSFLVFFAMLRIHDILGWIRIQTRGSMPLTNGFGSGSGSCYFRH
jgi:hypothetical protein